MIHQLRRFVPRQFADWDGTYLVATDLERRFRDCRVVDISSAGAGIELLDVPAEVTEGTRLFVAVHLQAEVRHVRPPKGDRVRVGTQFVDLTEAEHAYLNSLTELEARW